VELQAGRTEYLRILRSIGPEEDLAPCKLLFLKLFFIGNRWLTNLAGNIACLYGFLRALEDHEVYALDFFSLFTGWVMVFI
jgi:hypothetical protein